MRARTDAINGVTESFTSDNMNRLTNYDIAGGSSKTVGYDGLIRDVISPARGFADRAASC